MGPAIAAGRSRRRPPPNKAVGWGRGSQILRQRRSQTHGPEGLRMDLQPSIGKAHHPRTRAIIEGRVKPSRWKRYGNYAPNRRCR